jgi:DNA invertase Pin-like site-specific DNA recombinase
MLHIYAALAEKERRLISERTKAALAARKWPLRSTAAVCGRWHASNVKNLVDRLPTTATD